MAEYRKSINFDLDTTQISVFYSGGDSLSSAYTDIEKFLKANGFSHEQGSGYVSNQPMPDSEVLRVLVSLTDKFPWLNKCVRICKVTNITDISDYTDIFDKDKILPVRKHPINNASLKQKMSWANAKKEEVKILKEGKPIQKIPKFKIQ